MSEQDLSGFLALAPNVRTRSRECHEPLDSGRTDRAVPLCAEALELQRAKLGADHPDTLDSMIGS